MNKKNEKWSVVRVSKAAHTKLDDLKTKLNVEGMPVIIDMLLKVYNTVESKTPLPPESLIPDGSNPEKKLYQEEAEQSFKRKNNWLNIDNSKPPSAVLDCAILFLWSPKAIAAEKRPVGFSRIDLKEEEQGNPRTRREVMSFAKSQMEKDIKGVSWSSVFKRWFNNDERFRKTVDNRIKALMQRKIIINVGVMDIPQNIRIVEEMNSLIESAGNLTPEQKKRKYGRGVYKLIREVSPDEWTVIEGMLNIPPQRGISIPKIL